MFTARSDRAQWKLIYDNLSQMEIGDVVSLKELSRMVPGAASSSIRQAFYRAQKEMQKTHSRTFQVVRGTGYRMVDANEHEKLARGKHKSAKRQLQQARNIVASADRSRLTPEERRRLDELEHHLARQADMLKRLDDRQVKAEQRIAITEKEQLRLDDRMSEVEELLRRHGFDKAS